MAYPGPEYGPQWPAQPGPGAPPRQAAPYPRAGTPIGVVIARIIMWAQGVFWMLVALLLFIAAIGDLAQGRLADQDNGASRAGYLIGSVGSVAVIAVLAVTVTVLAARTGPGRPGVRTFALVLEGVFAVLWLIGLFGCVGLLVVHPAAGPAALVAVTAAGTFFPAVAFGCLAGGRARDHARMAAGR